MDRRPSLEAATLDTLPITVAVVDADGEILLTNAAWGEFAAEAGRERVEDRGVNYVAVAEGADDEYARRAAEGIKSVLDGGRDSFSFEYPCHSPDRKRWFLMRASRFDVGPERHASIVHLDITERKLAEMAAESTADRLRREHDALEHVLDRIDGLVRDVTDAAVDARSRDEVERQVCTRIVETDPYVLAWIGRVDVTGRRVTPRAWSATDGVPLEDADLSVSDDASHPSIRAIETGKTQVIDDVTDADADRWWPSGAGEWFRSVVALPIAYGDVTYGVLTVFAGDGAAFDAREKPVLESLAGTIATALNAIESRRLLSTDTVVELDLTVADRSLFLADLSARFEASIGYRGLLHEGDDLVLFFDADAGEALVEAVPEYDGVRECTALTVREEGVLFEVRIDGGLVATLTEHGASIRALDAAEGVVELGLDVATGQTARSIYGTLEDEYDRVELVKYSERERIARTAEDVAAALESELTDRQLTALRKAQHAGYYEWPRAVSGEDLADSMDISRSTFHQHLRGAERRIVEELFAGDRSHTSRIDRPVSPDE